MLVASPTRCLARVLAVLPLAVAVACSDSPVAPARTPRTEPQLLAAPTVTVTNTDDAGAGSLRQAIIDAAPGSVIQFDPGIAGQTIALTTGYLLIDKALTIEGPVPAGMTLSGELKSTVIGVSLGADLTLRNISVVNGFGDFGGGIVNDSRLTLDHSLVANNEAVGNGGGIYNSHNGELTLVNSTVSGNIADTYGGGILSAAVLTIRNSTIAENTSGSGGGGVWAEGVAFSMRNSIIANNVNLQANGDANCHVDQGIIINFSGLSIANGECVVTSNIAYGDAKLGPLADNGGPTKTHALLYGSPAIDLGSVCTEATDQRYVTRNQGSSCDAGAFEFTDYGKVTLTIGPNVAVNGKTGVVTVTGTIACSRPTFTSLSISLSQTQTLTGRFTTIVQGSATTSTFTCDTAPSSWSVTVTATAGKFKNGTATGRVATSVLPRDFLPADVTAPVKVFTVK